MVLTGGTAPCFTGHTDHIGNVISITLLAERVLPEYPLQNGGQWLT